MRRAIDTGEVAPAPPAHVLDSMYKFNMQSALSDCRRRAVRPWLGHVLKPQASETNFTTIATTCICTVHQ